MNCPNCNTNLVMTDRQGVEIDYCPTCRGVWLDRGELDKLIDRSTSTSQKRKYDYDDDDDVRFGRWNKSHVKKKKSGLLGEIFDF